MKNYSNSPNLSVNLKFTFLIKKKLVVFLSLKLEVKKCATIIASVLRRRPKALRFTCGCHKMEKPLGTLVDTWYTWYDDVGD